LENLKEYVGEESNPDAKEKKAVPQLKKQKIPAHHEK